ncbi:hypothetical protein MM300_01860 [Evansella sp. LMS18]|jgi:hypothetical protein|nr:hypothetical protein [Evansella sp. LMS18]UTR11102.1 hypothetical protein MM300_01860 [Evansella sp. LMS18]
MKLERLIVLSQNKKKQVNTHVKAKETIKKIQRRGCGCGKKLKKKD